MYYPHTTVVHIGGESAKSDSELTSTSAQISELQIESEMLYFRKQYGRSGAWLAIALASVADGVLVLKSIAKEKSLSGVGVYAKHFAATWSLFRRTAWATRATR